MQLPDRVKEIITILANQFPDLRRGDDDQRRALTLKFAQQIRLELGESWGTKRAAEGRPPSKDAVARMFDGKLFSADVINGSTREPQFPNMEELPGQIFIPVDPVNHIVDPVNPIEDPVDPVDVEVPLPDRVKEIITSLAARFPDLRKGDDDQRRGLPHARGALPRRRAAAPRVALQGPWRRMGFDRSRMTATAILAGPTDVRGR